MTPVSPLNASRLSPLSPALAGNPILAAATALEAQFLSEMLKAAGFGEARSVFGGGAGEAAFSDFLVAQYASDMAEKGGIGLAESIVSALAAGNGENA